MKTNVKFLNLFIILGLIIGITTSCDKDVPLTGIELDQVEANVMVGATLNLNVVFNPIDATNKNITWESSNTSAATVADGVVYRSCTWGGNYNSNFTGRQHVAGNLRDYLSFRRMGSRST